MSVLSGTDPQPEGGVRARLVANPKIVYADAPLSEQDATARLQAILREAPNALEGLNRQKAPYTERKPREHEWGLGMVRGAEPEAVLVVGDATGVTWTSLMDDLVPLAHTHPYFKAGSPRDRHGRVSTTTKEIADHAIGGRTVAGAVLWTDLVSEGTKPAEVNEMVKVFPSVSDLEFAGKQRLELHTVYTPYLVIDHAAGKVIANPDFGSSDMRANAPRLTFQIRNAGQLSGGDPTCELVALEDDTPLWQRADVTRSGVGDFATLVWW